MNTKNSASCLDSSVSRVFSLFLQKLKEYRYPICASLILGLFSYMFAFTNKLVIHDELTYMFSRGVTISSGRWGLELLSLILPDISLPWFNGILTLLLLTAAVCVILHMMEIRTPLFQVLTAGLIICFPSLTGTFGFMLASSSYGIAFLLSVLSVLFLRQKGWKSTLIGLIFSIFSIGIYQAYVAIAAGLMILILVRRTMYTEDPVRDIFLQGVKFLSSLILAMLIYAVLARFFQSVSGEGMNFYAGSALQNPDSLPIRILNCLILLVKILLFGYRGLMNTPLIRLAHLICLAIMVFELIFWAIRCRKKERIFMLLFLLVLFPFAINCMPIVSVDFFIHSLALYSIADLYVLMALLLENGQHFVSPRKNMNRFRACLMDLTALCMAVTIYGNTAIANQGYLNLHMYYENNFSYGTALAARLEELPGFSKNTPVALVGNFPAPQNYDKVFDVRQITGLASYATRGWDVALFMKYYCGADFNFMDFEEGLQFIYNDEYPQMDFFPGSDSIRMIDGTAVVKLDPWYLADNYLSVVQSYGNMPDTH